MYVDLNEFSFLSDIFDHFKGIFPDLINHLEYISYKADNKAFMTIQYHPKMMNDDIEHLPECNTSFVLLPPA